MSHEPKNICPHCGLPAATVVRICGHQPLQLIKPQDAADMLRVDLRTIARWTKNGYFVTPIYVGGCKRYDLRKVVKWATKANRDKIYIDHTETEQTIAEADDGWG